MKTRKMVFAGVILALGVLIPQAFHLTGVPQSGNVFLPMHIPVLIGGFLLGPVYGGIIGALSPLISSAFTGMPMMPRLPFMVGELCIYGLASGIFFYWAKLKEKKFGIYITLLGAMICGRIFYGALLFVAAYLLHIPEMGPMAAITATITGLPGILIQLVIIPPIVHALRKGGFLNE